VTELFILRHGNTFDEGDIVTRVGARTDLALSASGHAQADGVAAHFAERGLRFERIVAAPLKRTMMTAEAVLAATGGPPIEPLELLTEIDYGLDENQPEERVVARIGEQALKNWDENAVPPPGWRVDPKALIESWRSLFRSCAGTKGPVLAVTSNGVARFALDAADSLAGDFPRKLSTAAWGVAAIGADGKAEIKSWNERA
jgi:probable phosphoglycerate mutase